MVRVTRVQGLRGCVGYAEEFGPQSIATLLGVSSKGTTWFALQKNGPGSSRVCDRRGANWRQGGQLGVRCQRPEKRMWGSSY